MSKPGKNLSLEAARPTPGRPELEYEDATLEVSKSRPDSLQILQMKLGRRISTASRGN